MADPQRHPDTRHPDTSATAADATRATVEREMPLDLLDDAMAAIANGVDCVRDCASRRIGTDG
ncbi:MAG: hypothetical protein JSR59_00815 [Proteobacteria bacterium]|nr:hypothetical protein [Pseudomonadota bacterium]